MTDSPQPPRQPPNIFFRWVLITGAIFAITIFAMIAAVFGDPDSPPTKFFDRFGMPLLVAEVIAVGGVGFLALAIDRRQILREQQRTTEHSERPAATAAAPSAPISEPHDEP